MRQRRELRQFTFSIGGSAGRNSSGRITRIQRIKEWISCRLVQTGFKVLFSKPVVAFVAIFFSSFLGKEGRALMSTPQNMLLLFSSCSLP